MTIPNLTSLLVMGVALVWCIASGIMACTPVIGVTKLIWFQLTAIFLPGLLIQNKLVIHYKDRISLYLSSYALGFALFVFVYIVLLCLNVQRFSSYVYGAVSLISLTLWLLPIIRNPLSVGSPDRSNKNDLVVSAFFVLMAAISLFLYQIPNRSPEIVGHHDMYMDLMYWFRVCVAGTMEYPLPDLSISGLNVHWHYFSCLAVSAMHLCTGIEVYDLCFSFSCIWDMLLLLAGVYVVLNELLNKKAVIYLGCIIILFCSSIEHITLVSHLKHLYQCKLGCSQGMAFSMLSFLFVVRSFETNKFFPKELLLALVFAAFATGAKAPNACILLVGVGCLCLFTLSKTTFWRNALWGLSFIAVFLIVCKLFVLEPTSLVSENSNSKLALSVSDTVLHSPYLLHFYEFLAQYIGNSASLVLTWLLYIPSSNYILALLFVIATYSGLKTNSFKNPLILAMLCQMIVGLLMFMFVSHPGFSQLYFFLAVFPFVLIYSLMILEKVDFDNGTKLYKLTSCLVVVVLVLCAIFHEKDFYAQARILNDGNICSSQRNDVTDEEIRCLKWVRDNLPNDAIYTTNKDLFPMWRRSFVTSCFSERQMYFESSDYSSLRYSNVVPEKMKLLNDFYEGDVAAKEKLISDGVKYVIFYKGIGREMKTQGEFIYENRAIAVYCLQ